MTMDEVAALVGSLSGKVNVRTSDSWSAFGRLRGRSVAVYSPCNSYRYLLARRWNEKLPRTLVFVGLNPSTATENVDDPTIRKLIGFADRWGLGGLTMLNYFAFRSTDPKNLPSDPKEALGPLNGEVIDYVLRTSGERNSVLAFGWGANAKRYTLMGIQLAVKADRFGLKAKCFGTTDEGFPKHPLYLRGTSTLIDYEW